MDDKVEILHDDYPHFDLSFKLIVIGDSGKDKINIKWCGKVLFIYASN